MSVPSTLAVPRCGPDDTAGDIRGALVGQTFDSVQDVVVLEVDTLSA
jgi:hypothetical protein